MLTFGLLGKLFSLDFVLFPVLYFFVGRVFTTYHEFHIN